MRTLFLGDIHGNFKLVNDYINQFKIKNANIIQVGDFGLGFASFDKEKRMLELYHKNLVKNNVTLWAIRGNHDYKPYFDNDPFGFSNIKLIKDYTVLELGDKKILCIGGAISVDRQMRYTKKQKNGDFNIYGNESWWNDEIFELDINKVIELKGINTVVTHTAPSYCPPDNTFGFGSFVDGLAKNDSELKSELNFERFQMNELFHYLKLNGNNIDNHYYGHFHKNDKITIDGTIHRLLGIGELWEERV